MTADLSSIAINKMQKIGFITSSEDSHLTTDDLRVKEPLRKLGFELFPVSWDEFPISQGALQLPDNCAALVFRSCWNYHVKYLEFLSWLQILSAARIPVFNSIEISRWNLHKKYLLELEQKNIPVPRTFCLRGEDANFRDFFSQFLAKLPGAELVLKPAISMNGEDTFLLPKTDEKSLVESIQILQSKRGDVLVQEFLPEIQSVGELSFIFIDGQFSHALRKQAKAGEFRIHVEHGGRREAFQPSPFQIAQAEAIYKSIQEDLLFARVDVVERGDQLILLELEVIDPMLYFGIAPGAETRFAEAIAARIRENT